MQLGLLTNLTHESHFNAFDIIKEVRLEPPENRVAIKTCDTLHFVISDQLAALQIGWSQMDWERAFDEPPR